MSYRDLTREAIQQQLQDAELFESVGLTWLAQCCRRKAARLNKQMNHRPMRKIPSENRLSANA